MSLGRDCWVSLSVGFSCGRPTEVNLQAGTARHAFGRPAMVPPRGAQPFRGTIGQSQKLRIKHRQSAALAAQKNLPIAPAHTLREKVTAEKLVKFKWPRTDSGYLSA